MHKICADDPNFPVFQGPPLPLWPTFQKRLKKIKVLFMLSIWREQGQISNGRSLKEK